MSMMDWIIEMLPRNTIHRGGSSMKTFMNIEKRTTMDRTIEPSEVSYSRWPRSLCRRQRLQETQNRYRPYPKAHSTPLAPPHTPTPNTPTPIPRRLLLLIIIIIQHHPPNLHLHNPQQMLQRLFPAPTHFRPQFQAPDSTLFDAVERGAESERGVDGFWFGGGVGGGFGWGVAAEDTGRGFEGGENP